MARLVLEPLTRVEGRGRVEMTVSSTGLEAVKVRMVESPRLFESMVVGRRYDEVPDLVCRICAICSAVHKLTALQALEQSQAIKIPPRAEALRELLLLGGHIQSHALHLFCLVLPDFAEVKSVVDLLKQEDTLAKSGMALKAFGNCLQEVLGGRVIHPVNPVLGGVGYLPRQVELEKLLLDVTDWQLRWPGIAEEFLSRARYPEGLPACARPLATGLARRFSLNGDCLWPDGGQPLPITDYADYLDERSVDDSHAKQAMGCQGPFLVGALARVRLAAGRGCVGPMLPQHVDIHANNTAQVAEIGWSLDRARSLLEELVTADRDEPLRTAPGPPRAGVGTAVMEAPRGVLIHHYGIDEWGQVVSADIVTPTSINQLAMARQIMTDLSGETDAGILKNTAERIIRSFDPCISCAVHLIRI